MAKSEKGLVFNIQRYSVHDGPGIRTIVFLKGCPLRCLWCSNPESQSGMVEPGYNSENCLGCGRCAAACPNKAITHGDNGGMRIARDKCTPGCSSCSDACPGWAMTSYGKYMSASEVLDLVEEDDTFYARSGGGLTLSGGEPTHQPGFVEKILDEAIERSIDAAMETCGFAAQPVILNLCSKLDYLLYDIKHLDSAAHYRFTGQGNEIILDNLRAIRANFPNLPIHIRTPLIPGINDDEFLIREIMALAASIGAIRYEILPYHRMGIQKYAFLDKRYPFEGPDAVDEKKLENLRNMIAEQYPDED